MDEPLGPVELIEADALINVIHKAFGYDFRNYSASSQLRRLRLVASHLGCRTLSQLQHILLHQPDAFTEFLGIFSISVTEFFRDAEAYASIAQEVVPYLQTFAQFKIWHAGCASGEELYSLAILLRTTGILDRGRLYGTDINPVALATAREGVYDATQIDAASTRFAELGLPGRLRDHFSENYGAALINSHCRARALFSDHNLATDNNFGTFQLICCRNVLIYFDRQLQERAFGLFYDALETGGYLWLGLRENLPGAWLRKQFQCVNASTRLYRKCRPEADGSP